MRDFADFRGGQELTALYRGGIRLHHVERTHRDTSSFCLSACHSPTGQTLLPPQTHLHQLIELTNMTGRPLAVAAVAIVLCALAFHTVSAIPFTEAPDFRQMLGLSTSYYPQQDATTYTNPPETCTPVQIQRLARHGTRYPTIGTMRKLIKLESFIAAHIW